ncbi:MAG TPA: MFS transporter, partial [Verrucomicrobiae bacterium]|nr:MFS transporter [Verrucomicrobiae bacterium]
MRFKAFPRPVWVLFFGTFLNKFGTFVIPFLALYLKAGGFSVAQAGMAISAYGVGNFLASAVGGHLADTLGRRNSIVFSMFSVAVSMMLLSQARQFPAILLFTALVGLTGEMYRPAASALLADVVPAGERVTAYSAYRLAFNAGWAFGPATAGFLAGHSYLWLFGGDAGSSVLFGIVAWLALPHGLRAAKSEQGWQPALKIISRDKVFLRVLAASFTVSLVFMQMGSTFSLHVTGLGFSATNYGALLSLNGVMVVFCELPITTFITQRFPPRRMMALGYLLTGTGFAINAFARTLPVMTLAVLIFTLGEIVSVPVSAAYVADLAPEQFRGRYSGAVGLTSAIALILGPNLGMRLFGSSPFALWIICGVLGLFGAIIISSG